MGIYYISSSEHQTDSSSKEFVLIVKMITGKKWVAKSTIVVEVDGYRRLGEEEKPSKSKWALRWRKKISMLQQPEGNVAKKAIDSEEG